TAGQVERCAGRHRTAFHDGRKARRGCSLTGDAMKMRTAWLGSAWLLCSALALAQSSSVSLFDKIRAEGYDRSQAASVFNTLTIDIGPRLTASPAHKRAAEYMRDRLPAFGPSHARLEPWEVRRARTLA